MKHRKRLAALALSLSMALTAVGPAMPALAASPSLPLPDAC